MKIVEAYIHTGSLKNKGITLIALVITIIILLILAGITIVGLKGNGLFGKTEIAKQKTRYAAAKETVNLKLMEIQVECTDKGKDYNIKKIAEGMKQAENITIEKYYNKGIGSIKDGVTENLTDLEGIIVSVDEYSEYKFLIGEESEIEGVLEGEVTETTSKEEFTNIEEFEKNTFRDEIATDTISFSYEKRAIGSNKMQILITIKDEENGLNKIEYPDGDILNCNGKNQVGIDYTIEYGVEYIFKITSDNGYVKEVKIYEVEETQQILFKTNETDIGDWQLVGIVENASIKENEPLTFQTYRAGGTVTAYYKNPINIKKFNNIKIEKDYILEGSCGGFDVILGTGPGMADIYTYSINNIDEVNIIPINQIEQEEVYFGIRLTVVTGDSRIYYIKEIQLY